MCPLGLSLFLLLASPSWAQYGPFAELPGNWSGKGQVTFQDGRKGDIRCTALYVVSAEGNELTQTFRCVGSDAPLDLRTNVTYRGGIVSGTWTFAPNLSGKLEGRAGGGHFAINISMGNAKLSLVTYGNIQSARLESDTEMREVFIRLVRSEP